MAILSSEDLMGERVSLSELTHVIICTLHSLAGCWVEGLRFLITTSWKPPSVLWYVGLSIGQLTIWQLAFLRVSKRECLRWNLQSFCNLILEITSNHICCILYLIHNQGKGFTQRHEHWEVGIIGVHLRGCPLHPLEERHSNWELFILKHLQFRGSQILHLSSLILCILYK